MECVRCVVTLALKELCWEDPPGCPLHLEGPPVFLRACLLGQLQHSPLFRPTFPLHLQSHTLTFDRVLTNCSDPSLLKEIVTGEHVYVEMVQVTEDYEGGRILARYEAPADKFLFPRDPPRPGQLQTLSLCRSREYQHCPKLTLTTSTSITKVTVQTPFPLSLSSRQPPPVGETPREGAPLHPIITKPSRKVGVATKDKLRLLLDSYTEPRLEQPPGKIWSPNLRPSSVDNQGKLRSVGGRNFKLRRPLTVNPPELYHCCTANIGPHDWTSCPRRGLQQHSRGATHGGRKSRSKSAPYLEIEGGPGKRNSDPPPRPFVAGRVDASLLAKRDFCGGTEGKTAERESGGGVRGREACSVPRWRRERESRFTSLSQDVAMESEDGKRKDTSTQLYQHLLRDSAAGTAPPSTSPEVEDTAASSPGASEPSGTCDSHVTGSGGEESPPLSDDDVISGGDDVSPPNSPQDLKHVCRGQQRRKLVSKYLRQWNGNGGMGTDPGPAGLIEHKLQTLIRDCCECRRSAEGLGKDDMSEDDERLRASLSAEREDVFNKSAKLLPEKSVLVGLGEREGEGKEGGRDFWSQRVAQFQGKHHRQVFNETVEKIYCRLYQRATSLS